MILGFLGIATFWFCTASYMVIGSHYKENKKEVEEVFKKINMIERIKNKNLLTYHYQSNKATNKNKNLQVKMTYREEILKKEEILNPSYFYTYKNLFKSREILDTSTIEQLNYLDALFLDMSKELLFYEEHGNKVPYISYQDTPYKNREMINNFFVSIVIMESEIVDGYFKQQINEFYDYLEKKYNN